MKSYLEGIPDKFSIDRNIILCILVNQMPPRIGHEQNIQLKVGIFYSKRNVLKNAPK